MLQLSNITFKYPRCIIRNCALIPEPLADYSNISHEASAMGGLFRTFRIIPTADAGADYEEVLAEAEEQLSQILEVHRGFGCKFYLVASLSMSRLIHEERQPTYHHSKTATLLRSTPILPEVQNQTRVFTANPSSMRESVNSEMYRPKYNASLVATSRNWRPADI